MLKSIFAGALLCAAMAVPASGDICPRGLEQKLEAQYLFGKGWEGLAAPTAEGKCRSAKLYVEYAIARTAAFGSCNPRMISPGQQMIAEAKQSVAKYCGDGISADNSSVAAAGDTKAEP